MLFRSSIPPLSSDVLHNGPHFSIEGPNGLGHDNVSWSVGVVEQVMGEDIPVARGSDRSSRYMYTRIHHCTCMYIILHVHVDVHACTCRCTCMYIILHVHVHVHVHISKGLLHTCTCSKVYLLQLSAKDSYSAMYMYMYMYRVHVCWKWTGYTVLRGYTHVHIH